MIERDSAASELEALMASKSRLIRGFAHDIKNPLGAADGRADLLLAGVVGELTAEQVAHLEGIRRSLKASIALVDLLVEFSRVEAGQIEVQSQDIDIGVVARDAADDHMAAAQCKGLDLVIECDGAPRVQSDPDRVRQILSNLLSNAVKYTTAGSVHLHVELPAPGEGGDYEASVAIRVRDTGRGIPAGRTVELFREFTRIDPEDKSGSGLGLAISRRLARLLGGDITVCSEEGSGSTFTLLLPPAAPVRAEVPIAAE
ncbi:MAG: HAMP domain-containing sensor histidine kinase [Gemmatimonadota bacterium]